MSFAFVLMIAILGMRFGQSAKPGDVATVDRLCGTLVHVADLETKRNQRGGHPKAAPLGKIILDLFPRRPENPCCTNLSPVSETKTGRQGDFEFKRLPVGDFWMVARVENHEYKLAIQYQPTKSSIKECRGLIRVVYAIDDAGNFGLGGLTTIPY